MDAPEPNTTHPFYSNYAHHIRLSGRTRVKVQMVDHIDGISGLIDNDGYSKSEQAIPIVTYYLHRKTAWGPAPFIGDPLMWTAGYFWDFWVDAEGRWIAGDSKLEWAPCYKGKVM